MMACLLKLAMILKGNICKDLAEMFCEYDIYDQLDGSASNLLGISKECLGIFLVSFFYCSDDDIQTCVYHASY